MPGARLDTVTAAGRPSHSSSTAWRRPSRIEETSANHRPRERDRRHGFFDAREPGAGERAGLGEVAGHESAVAGTLPDGDEAVARPGGQFRADRGHQGQVTGPPHGREGQHRRCGHDAGGHVAPWRAHGHAGRNRQPGARRHQHIRVPGDGARVDVGQPPHRAIEIARHRGEIVDVSIERAALGQPFESRELALRQRLRRHVVDRLRRAEQGAERQDERRHRGQDGDVPGVRRGCLDHAQAYRQMARERRQFTRRIPRGPASGSGPARRPRPSGARPRAARAPRSRA